MSSDFRSIITLPDWYCFFLIVVTLVYHCTSVVKTECKSLLTALCISGENNTDDANIGAAVSE